MAARPISREDLEHVLEHTRDLWEELRGQRLFMTGGTGFFGCWLLETFCHINSALELGAQVVVLSRNPYAFRTKMPHLTSRDDVTLLEGDVSNFTYPHGDFYSVIHAANEVNRATMQAGTERTLKFAATHGTKKFLFTSSGAVYGQQPPRLTHIPETYLGAVDLLDGNSTYAESKRASESMCSLSGAHFECKIARCFAFCGPHLPLDANFAIGNFIGDVLARRTIHVQGDGTARRSYLYAADLCIWLWTILFKAPPLIPFNVGSANDLSILEIAQAVAESLGFSSPIHVAQQPLAGARPARYVPSVDRALRMLRLHQHVDLHEAIRRTASWYS